MVVMGKWTHFARIFVPFLDFPLGRRRGPESRCRVGQRIDLRSSFECRSFYMKKLLEKEFYEQCRRGQSWWFLNSESSSLVKRFGKL